MRRTMIAGNWKMNLEFNEALTLVAELVEWHKSNADEQREVLLFPPAIYTRHTFEFLRNAGSSIQLGVQDVAATTDGAYTGELSASMTKVAGATYTLVGHSERRSYFHENDAVLLAKVQRALESGLSVVFCCGEHLEERKAEQHFQRVEAQLNAVIGGLSEAEMERIVIAYEPVWAIGTGETASPAQAQEMHAFIRQWLQRTYGENTADACRILYGGSMKPANATELLSQPDVDGGLIGGASLKADQFTAIISA